MPTWLHARAEHILAKNPSMPKSEAFAIATQQSHALGKTPKSYGTAEGKAVAKAKYDTPGDDKRTANLGNLDSPKLRGKPKKAEMEKASSVTTPSGLKSWAVADHLGAAIKNAKTPGEKARAQHAAGQFDRWEGSHAEFGGSGKVPPYSHAWEAGMRKTAQSLLPLAALGAGTGLATMLATMGGIYAVVGEKGRKRINSEIRDPRLYSNLRGIAESAEDRVAAHKHLKRGKHHTVMSAMREGFTRGGGKEKKAWEDKLPGGLSDNKVPDQFDPSALREGRRVESEHTKDKHLQTEISMDHLTEDPEYYGKLKKVEKRAFDTVMMAAFSDELQKIAAEKDSQFNTFIGGGKKAPNLSVSSAPRSAPSVGVVQRGSPTGRPFTPAVTGVPTRAPATTVRPQPPRGALNPGGGMT